jgi:peptidoglycan/LPS O-acetylase OafA/YrhL
LFFELAVNWFLALVLSKGRRANIPWLLGLFAVLLIGILHFKPDLDTGFTWRSSFAGLTRALFGVFMGYWMGEQLLKRQFIFKSRWLLTVGLLGATAALLGTSSFRHHHNAPFALFCIFFGWPAIVAVAVKMRVPGCLEPFFEVIGEISYPIYAFHTPFCMVAISLAGSMANSHSVLPGLVTLLALCTFSLLVSRLIDRPVRRRLLQATKAFFGRPSLPQTAA